MWQISVFDTHGGYENILLTPKNDWRLKNLYLLCRAAEYRSNSVCSSRLHDVVKPAVIHSGGCCTREEARGTCQHQSVSNMSLAVETIRYPSEPSQVGKDGWLMSWSPHVWVRCCCVWSWSWLHGPTLTTDQWPQSWTLAPHWNCTNIKGVQQKYRTHFSSKS